MDVNFDTQDYNQNLVYQENLYINKSLFDGLLKMQKRTQFHLNTKLSNLSSFKVLRIG